VPDSISEFRLWLWRFKFTSWIQLWKNSELILSFHRLDIFRRDKINITTIITSELQFNTVTDIARFKALQCNESGSWLDAIPSKNIGTFIKAVNTYAVLLLTYSFSVIKWSKTNLQNINIQTRVLFTKFCKHHPKSAIERFIYHAKMVVGVFQI
jgi:hypothetical protein